MTCPHRPGGLGFGVARRVGCQECGQLFARYWWEVIDWIGEDDEIRRYWVPITPAEAEVVRDNYGAIRELVKSRRHLAQEADGSFEWREGGFFGPAFLPSG